jgi:nucleotide-binding universal stress UspA family protein
MERRRVSLASETPARIGTHPVRSDPVEAITRVASEEAADLIVVGSQAGHGSRRLSSVPQAVMNRVGCPALVV